MGFGAVAQGTLPLMLRHIDMPRENVKVITAEPWGREIAEEYGVAFAVEPLTRQAPDRVAVADLAHQQSGQSLPGTAGQGSTPLTRLHDH